MYETPAPLQSGVGLKFQPPPRSPVPPTTEAVVPRIESGRSFDRTVGSPGSVSPGTSSSG